MPRPIIVTTLTPRVKPTTQYSTPRSWSVMNLTCDTTLFTCDSALITCDATEVWMPSVTTAYNRPRYASYIEDLTWANVLDLTWNQVLWISGNQVNKIDTVYT